MTASSKQWLALGLFHYFAGRVGPARAQHSARSNGSQSTAPENLGDNILASVDGHGKLSHTYGLDLGWYVRETLRAAFSLSLSSDKRFVASIYTAYLDDSGTHDGSEAVVAAGFISSATEAGILSTKWQKALTEWGIDLFHMADFENRQRSFADWTNDEREQRLNCLLGLIETHMFGSLGWIIPKRAFDETLSEKAKTLCGDAFGLAAIGCFQSSAEVATDPRLDGYLDYVVESGSRGYGALQIIWAEGSKDKQWLNANRILSLDSRPKLLFPPLQAADILAYELYKHGLRMFGDERRPTRYPLKRIAKMHNGSHHWHYPSDDHLKRINDSLTAQWDRINS